MRILTLVLVIAFFAACGSEDGGQETGTEGGPCYANNTCNDGLECASDLCVQASSPSDTVEDVSDVDTGTTPDVLVSDLGPDGQVADVEGEPDESENDIGEDTLEVDTDVHPSDTPGVDQGSDDFGCTPLCNDKVCGDDGCGGSCGECGGQAPYCEEGICVPQCAAESPAVTGWLKNSVSDMDFTGEPVDVQLFHKLDIDEWEDGCISKYLISMSKLGLGCEFSLQVETDSYGGVGVTEAVLIADSFCPGWSDPDEGEYQLSQSSLVVCSDVEATEYLADSTCIPDVSLGFSGSLTLERLSDGKILDVDLSELQVVGHLLSTGDTTLSCPDMCGYKDCGDDACGRSCGICQSDWQCGADQRCFNPCSGKNCGDDGYGGSCGTCQLGSYCLDTQVCFWPCYKKECGPDGFGGSCGDCSDETECVENQCFTTWVDLVTGFEWQEPSTINGMSWEAANTYCSGISLSEGEWRLPTIGELRSLIQGCEATYWNPVSMEGGACGVVDDCLDYSCWKDSPCSGCTGYGGPGDGGLYLDPATSTPSTAEHVDLWSSSSRGSDTDRAWYVPFHYGSVSYSGVYANRAVRCLRSE